MPSCRRHPAADGTQICRLALSALYAVRTRCMFSLLAFLDICMLERKCWSIVGKLLCTFPDMSREQVRHTAFVHRWDVALHRAVFLVFWLNNAPPLLWAALALLFIVDLFYLADTVKRHNKNPLDNTKTKCQAYLMMLPPVGCFGMHHAYFRNWTQCFLYSATGSGFGIAYIVDCFRMGKYTQDANARLHGAPQMSILVRDTLRRYVMPTYLCLYRKYWLPQLPPSPFDEEAQSLVQGSSDDHDAAAAAPRMQPSATVGATAGRAAAPPATSTQEAELDQEELVPREQLLLSLCPCAHWTGLSASCAGAPRQGLLHVLTCSGCGILYLIDLCSLTCRQKSLNAHKHMRRRALNVGIPAPREEIPTANAYGACCTSGLCGCHQLILGNFWLFLGTLMSLGGFGILWLSDAYFLKGYLATYRQQRAHEEALVGTVESAKRWGSASMQLQEGEGETTTTRSITVGSASAGAAVDAFAELDGAPPVSLYTAWVCWLPFGGLFGLHHLYLGRYAHFAVALCTLNVFLLGWILDAFMMKWYVADAAYKYNKKVLAQAAGVHTTQPGLEGGLHLGQQHLLIEWGQRGY